MSKFKLSKIPTDSIIFIASILIVTLLLPIIIVVTMICAPFELLSMYLSNKNTTKHFEQSDPEAADRYRRNARILLLLLPFSPILRILSTLFIWFMHGPYALYLHLSDLFHQKFSSHDHA